MEIVKKKSNSRRTIVKSVSLSPESLYHVKLLEKKDKAFNFSKWVDTMVKIYLTEDSRYLESRYRMQVAELNDIHDKMRTVGVEKPKVWESSEEFKKVFKEKNKTLLEVKNDNR